jgi:Fe-Mn family superoxide dismutase
VSALPSTDPRTFGGTFGRFRLFFKIKTNKVMFLTARSLLKEILDMAYSLAPLGYKYDALEPFIDAQTMEIHHSKHHATYIAKLNAALEDHADLQDLPVETLIADLNRIPEKIRQAVRNHGGGHANHTFFWSLLKKDVPFEGDIAEAIASKFGGLDQFKEQFNQTAAAVFGSGWAWLVLNNGELEIVGTPNQDSPLSVGKTPLLGVDVWEHAYYLKYQNRRPDYLDAIFNVFNWSEINSHLLQARQAAGLAHSK